jgi:pyrroline-5-carboxylate reductase
MLSNKKIGFIGSGNMASVLIKGILKADLVNDNNIYASDIDLEKLDSLKSEYGINTVFKDNNKIVNECDVVIFAVKPQIMEKVIKEINSSLTSEKLFISIAAGISTEYIDSFTDTSLKIIRAMPNTPALIMEGATAICPGANVSEDDLRIAKEIFSAVGVVAIVDESQMDAVTGLSGSGPAYVFMIIEALSDAGVKMGLSRNVSMKLAAQTVMGAAKLQIDTGMHPGRLKDMVTSPGGTAIAGIHTLEQGGLRTTLINAVENATLRSIQLGKKNGK